jgi:dihydropteroate synthase
VVCLRSLVEAEQELVHLGLDAEGIAAIAPKALMRAIKLYGIPAEDARRIKSHMLRLGGDVALPTEVYFRTDGATDVLILGTLSELIGLNLTLRAAGDHLTPLVDSLDRALAAFVEPPPPLKVANRTFEWGRRTYVMGIINITPDSFSGDGLGNNLASAVEQAKRFADEGADILDIGGESTRPGHTPVSTEDELQRVIPVVAAIAKAIDLPISIDTYKAAVAREALAAGASIVNDVWGLCADPRMATLVAETGAPVIIMHNQAGTNYEHMLDDVLASLAGSVQLALDAGVEAGKIIIDPGIGFGKTWQQNLELLSHMQELKSLGYPILLGTSRKSTIGKVLNLDVDERVEGTAATVALGIQNGADIVRVHDVKEIVRVSRMSDAIVRQGWQR